MSRFCLIICCLLLMGCSNTDTLPVSAFITVTEESPQDSETGVLIDSHAWARRDQPILRQYMRSHPYVAGVVVQNGTHVPARALTHGIVEVYLVPVQEEGQEESEEITVNSDAVIQEGLSNYSLALRVVDSSVFKVKGRTDQGVVVHKPNPQKLDYFYRLESGGLEKYSQEFETELGLTLSVKLSINHYSFCKKGKLYAIPLICS